MQETDEKDYDVVREGSKEYIRIKLKDGITFTGKMLVKNDIASLLKGTLREFNSESFVYYDISGKIPFSEMFCGENDIMEPQDTDRLCESFKRLAAEVRDYLLDLGEVDVRTQTLFYNPEEKSYEFLYVPGRDSGSGEDFYEGVKRVWDRVMEKFNHQSDIESIARVYDIYQKLSMSGFDLEEVFAPKKEKLIKNEKTEEMQIKDNLREKIAGSAQEHTFSSYPAQDDIIKDTVQEDKKSGGIMEGLKLKLAGSTGIFSSFKDDRENKIEEIQANMEKEEKLDYKIKNYLALNSSNIFKVLMCVAVLFLVLALLPGSVGFKPPVSACVGVFLVSVAVAVYARKLGKERAE